MGWVRRRVQPCCMLSSLSMVRSRLMPYGLPASQPRCCRRWRRRSGCGRRGGSRLRGCCWRGRASWCPGGQTTPLPGWHQRSGGGWGVLRCVPCLPGARLLCSSCGDCCNAPAAAAAACRRAVLPPFACSCPWSLSASWPSPSHPAALHPSPSTPLPQEIEEFCQTATGGATPEDPFEGLTPAEIDDYIAQQGMPANGQL